MGRGDWAMVTMVAREASATKALTVQQTPELPFTSTLLSSNPTDSVRRERKSTSPPNCAIIATNATSFALGCKSPGRSDLFEAGVGVLEVHTVGIVRLGCKDKEGVPVLVELYKLELWNCRTIELWNWEYIPQANANMFNLRKTKKIHYKVEQPQRIGTKWIRSQTGRYVGSMAKDEEGRAVVRCITLVPPSSSHFSSPSKMLPGV